MSSERWPNINMSWKAEVAVSRALLKEHNQTLSDRLDDLNEMEAELRTDLDGFDWKAMGMVGALVLRADGWTMHS